MRQKIASMDVSKTSMNVSVMCNVYKWKCYFSSMYGTCRLLFPKRINCIDSIDCDCGFKYLTAAEQFLCHDTSHVTRDPRDSSCQDTGRGRLLAARARLFGSPRARRSARVAGGPRGG